MKRALWLLLPLGFLWVVSLAFFLEPSESGHGTHQALGLPPCLFWFLTGKLCPSCGLTTSFTHLVHMNLTDSFLAHPLGPLLFALFALLTVFSLLEFFEIHTPLRKFLQGQYTGWLYPLLALYLGIWGLRVFWLQT